MPWTIKEAAQQLGLTDRTIRNHIKSGKIPHARLQQGRWGEEWIIDALPRELGHTSSLKLAKSRLDTKAAELESKVEALNTLVAVLEAQIEVLKGEKDKLHQENLNLSRMVGQLEGQTKQIGRSWWNKLFGR